ncbi:MAG: enoyl-CoA hydratase-related protein, partial [Actinomycetota bacterium]|nr:enoyl-CoA hydratase-related protein [Actinomycetota bacterium]
MSADRELVAVEQRGRITIITLQRHEKRNAFDPDLSHALDDAINGFEDDPDQWVAVLTGGPDMFSAGSDLAAGSATTARGGE